MPRIRVGRTIEVHYQSPHDLVDHLTRAVETGEIPLPDDAAIDAGGEHSITINAPWLGRTIRVTGLVTRKGGGEESLSVRLIDRPDSCLDQILDILARASAGGADRAESIHTMGPNRRALLAVRADHDQRRELLRDPNPRIISLLLRNPSITIEEIRRIAARPGITPRHLTAIASNTTWMRDNSLRIVLARHPRLPEELAPGILESLSTRELREIAVRQETVAPIRRIAVNILKERGIRIAKGQAING